MSDPHGGAAIPPPRKGAGLNQGFTERATAEAADATSAGTSDGRSPAGRTPDTSDGVVLAIDFGGTKVAVCACTRRGEPVAQDVIETTPSLGAEANFSRAAALAARLAGTAPVVAVGACTFGIPHDDGVALAPAIDGWEHLSIRRRLEAAFGAPVAVATDVKVAAAAEVRSGALKDCDPAIYLNLGTGLAVALVVGGEVVRGAHGAAGEIGYGLLRATGLGATTAVGGGPGRAGRTGMGGRIPRTRAPGADVEAGGRVLEDVVSGMGLARALDGALRDSRGVRSVQEGPDHVDDRGRTAADAKRVAAAFAGGAGDARSERILSDFIEELAFHLVNLAVALDPERIAVGGGIARAWDRIEGGLRRALSEHVPYPPELVLGAYPFDAALRGAIDLGVALAADGAAADTLSADTLSADTLSADTLSADTLSADTLSADARSADARSADGAAADGAAGDGAGALSGADPAPGTTAAYGAGRRVAAGP